MEFLFFILLLVVVAWVLLQFVGAWASLRVTMAELQERADYTKREQADYTKSVRRQWRRTIEERLGVVDVAYGGFTLGVNTQRRAIAVIGPDGEGKWIPYEAIAGVELTPEYSRFEEGTSETTTRRGSQLFGAGIGAAIAGPAGLVVGGLSGGTRTTSSSSSSEHVSAMELKLRLLSEEEPLLNLGFSGHVDFDPETKQFEGGFNALERIAARLVTEIERRKDGPALPGSFTTFEHFTVEARPNIVGDATGEPRRSGWWQRTFG